MGLIHAASTAAASPLPSFVRHGNADTLPAWSQREALAAEPPWTASRCQRQLRPLLTHLAALRRETAIAALKTRNDDASTQRSQSAKRSIPAPTDGLTCRKRVRYTYSRKGRSKSKDKDATRHRLAQSASGLDSIVNHSADPSANLVQHTKTVSCPPVATRRSVCPGEVVVATPVLRRAQNRPRTSSLPSSPIASCMAAASRTDGGVDANEAERKQPRPRAANVYRGYYHGRGSDTNARSPIDAEWAILSKTIPPELRRLYASVLRAVDALLRATAATTVASAAAHQHPHPKSLLAMCLRRVPQYISVCEDVERQEADENGTARSAASTASDDIYSYLESSLGGGTDATGWRPLRILVREHAISILKAACAEGLLHEGFVRLLIRLCTGVGAYSEAEGLMTALFERYIALLAPGQTLYATSNESNESDELYTLDEPNNARADHSALSVGPMASLRMLLRYIDETGRTSAPLQLLASLFGSGHLPVAWLSTYVFGHLWHRVVRLLSSRGAPACDESILLDFATTAVVQLVISPSAHGDPVMRPGLTDGPYGSTPTPFLSSSASYNTLVSIIGSICAVGILQREAPCATDAPVEPAVLKRLSIIIQRSLLDTERAAQPGKRRLTSSVSIAPCRARRCVLALASHLSSLPCGADIPESPSSIQNMNMVRAVAEKAGSTQQQTTMLVYSVAVALVTSVAESCGRGAVLPLHSSRSLPASRSYLLRLCAHVCDCLVGLVGVNTQDTLLLHLCTDTAFLLASRSGDLRDLAFAESLGKKSCEISELALPKDARQTITAISTSCSAPTVATRARAVFSPPAKAADNAPRPGLFEGYRWEEGISEWVLCMPTSVSGSPGQRQDRRVANGGQREAAMPAKMETSRKSSTSSSKRSKTLSVATPYATPSTSAWDTPITDDFSAFSDLSDSSDSCYDDEYKDISHDENNGVVAGVSVALQPMPITPRNRATTARNGRTRPFLGPLCGDAPWSSDADGGPRGSYHGRTRLRSIPGKARGGRPTRQSFVVVFPGDESESDNEDDADYDQVQHDCHDTKAGREVLQQQRRQRNEQQKQRLTSTDNKQQTIDDIASDDELCL